MANNQPYDSIEKEFDEMKERYENFIKPLDRIRDIKVNVFYHIVDNKRTKKELVEMARETRPFMAKEIWDLLNDFMEFMRNVPEEEGNNYKLLYEGFTPADLVKRLLFKRPLVFVGPHDHTILRFNGEKNVFSSNRAFKVAKTLDNPPDGDGYCLREYISYDENLLSSLISMSTPTFYVSDGSISFIGSTEGFKKPHIDQGILCGLVGARNTKYSFMEHRFINIRQERQWTGIHLSDQFWIKNVYSEAFPEGFIPTEANINANKKMYEKIYIDRINVVYLEKRLMLSILPYIKEAAARGKEKMKEVFCSVPPIGGGVWRGNVKAITIHNLIVNGILKFFDQKFNYEELKMLKAFALPETSLDVYTSFNHSMNIQSIKENADKMSVTVTFKEPMNHTIKIFNEIRYVAKPLPVEFEHCLSIAGYAWDGNSYPGNEYWSGDFGSFDPQAIYCSLLGQFQNPEVNINMANADRIKIYEI
ncbi:hypothetical protein PVAND_010599 [Polypedilum vanderplanki]|uniref:Uncharacterized protein n=1 Tax=Polypedilum vanderplanki TaxID=319348 RepID=A0A9J6CH93_POLVA|nr:hypothetical protein PVAND_010599 [Polypedilum vanderplanki]